MVDNYQVTSKEQKKQISAVIAGNENIPTTIKSKVQLDNESRNSLEVTVKDRVIGGENLFECSCQKNCFKVNDSAEVGSLVSNILSLKKHGKTKLKLEIEFSD